MKLGMCEVILYDERRFSDKDLMNLATTTLQISPLDKFYTETRVVPAIDMSRYRVAPGTSVAYVTWDILAKPEYRDHPRKKYGVDVLAYVAYHEFSESEQNISSMGFSYGPSEEYGKGPIFIYGTHPNPKIVAHEIGHLCGLDHKLNGEDDIMSVWVGKIDTVSTFSPANRMHIEGKLSKNPIPAI